MLGFNRNLSAGTPVSALTSSRYNFAVRDSNGRVALFNAKTGSLLLVDGLHSKTLSDSLLDPQSGFEADEFSSEMFHKLWRGGFLVSQDIDERSEVRERYWRARGETPVVITITTTMDCNLGCYYCYEERSGNRLEASDVGAIVDLARRSVQASGKHGLHIDWYGGEPLLNAEFMMAASVALQAYCDAEGITYVSSIISNGTEWPENVEEFVREHRIRQVQISFDGLKANHDKRRRYRKGYNKKGVSSFEVASGLVGRLVKCVRVDLRFNLDRGNSLDLIPFIDFARNQGWFSAAFPAVFQPARLASYSDSSKFMRSQELTLEEFDDLRALVRQELSREALVEESEVPDGYPSPKNSVCAALARNSIVVGAEGLTYRCGLQVGERPRAVGTLASRNVAAAPDNATDEIWWDTFDPTKLESCGRCSFLPICWGGCPKKHLEGDQHALKEQGRYWRSNLPRLIATAANFGEFDDREIAESLQFR